jgi:outer membrane biosynthesis protein TonB
MSALGRAAAVAREGQRGTYGSPTTRQRFPQLTLLRRPIHRAPRTPFAVLLVIIAGLGLVGLLLINTQLQQGAVQISRIDRENQILRERVQTLTQNVAAAAAPQRLAARAHELGMVPNPRPAFLRISDGTVLGDPKVAEGPPPPPPQPAPVAAQPTPATTPEPSAPEAQAPAQAPASPADQPVVPATEVPQ